MPCGELDGLGFYDLTCDLDEPTNIDSVYYLMQNQTTPTLTRRWTCPRAGTYTVSFDIRCNGSSTTYAKVYKNVATFGTEQSTTSASYVTKTEALTFAAGDYIEVYIKSSNLSASLTNFVVKSAAKLFG